MGGAPHPVDGRGPVVSATLVLDPERLGRLAELAEVAVEGDAYRHLFRARRLAVGDRLRAVDGAGAARWAEVAAVDRRTGTLRLLEPAPTHEPAYRLELLVGTPKKDRAATLVEKATEVGVAAVRFVATERSPRDFGSGTLARLAPGGGGGGRAVRALAGAGALGRSRLGGAPRPARAGGGPVAAGHRPAPGDRAGRVRTSGGGAPRRGRC